MKYYLAPLEGITGYIYRNAYEKVFHNIDKYFTPFVVPNQSKKLKTKELRDILPENNKNMNVVPQILTNNSEYFINTAIRLKDLGYDEINLNLGCPSGTVVSKGKGSGFLAHREELDRFLDEIYKIEDMKISLKTRLGIDSADEFTEIMKIYNKYPLEELIIHPRTQKDYYKNTPNLEVFKEAMASSKNPICYNGDIFSVNDHNKLITDIPSVDKIMLGRGIIANPGLMSEIINGTMINKEILRDFHNEIFNGYIELFKDETIVLYKMKEVWGYMIWIFSDNKKYAKKIKKSQNLNEYRAIVSSLLAEQQIIEGCSLFNKNKEF